MYQVSLEILSGDSAFSKDNQKLSQGESGNTSDALEAFLVLGKNLKLTLPDLHPLGSASSAPHDCDFLNPLPKAGSETHQEDGLLPHQPPQAKLG